jgi:hypothetical protein
MGRDAIGAERAFVAADAGIRGVRRQILVAPFAVGSELQAAAASIASCRWGALDALRSRTCARIAGGALSGVPASKGGSGAYSIPSWIACAISGPAISAIRVNAKSIPAVTPPPVIKLPSRTTRPGSGIAPNSASWSRQAQWLVARLPRKRPAAPSSSDPVHTEVT